MQVRGTDYKTPDGTCIRDYIDVTDLVDAHVKALEKAQPAKVGIYNVGTGKGKLNTWILFSEVYVGWSENSRKHILNQTKQPCTFDYSISACLSGSSVKQFVEACKMATGVDIKVEFLPRRPGDYAEVYSDPRKIKRELNWSAKHTDLQQSLRVAWRWQKSHLDGYGVPNEMPWITWKF